MQVHAGVDDVTSGLQVDDGSVELVLEPREAQVVVGVAPALRARHPELVADAVRVGRKVRGVHADFVLDVWRQALVRLDVEEHEACKVRRGQNF